MEEIKPVKTEDDMRNYFERLVKNKKFKAYDATMNTKQIIEDAEDYTLFVS